MVEAKMNVGDIKAKFKTKKDVYTFLVLECDVYLPDERHCTIFWLKDLLAGKCKVCTFLLFTSIQTMKNEQVVVIQLPHYDGLRVENFLNFVKTVAALRAYFPEERDWSKLPRDWICVVS